jgi:DNA segregation ATPase FtsK/SpoIIIE, S-DNA-T family
MRLALTVVSPARQQSADIVLDADPATPMRAVAAELERFAGGGGGTDRQGIAGVLKVPAQSRPSTMTSGGALAYSAVAEADTLAIPLYVDYQEVSPWLTLAEAPIVDGSVISLGSRDGCVIPEPAGLVDLRVAGGPGAGVIHRLGSGHVDIGSGADVAVRISDQAIPEQALHLYVDYWAGCQVTAYEGVTATIDREPLVLPTQWQPGQQLTIGDTLLDLALYTPPDAALHPSQDGAGADFNRPPRLLPPRPATKFSLPAPPTPQERRPLPVLMAILPLVMGVGMAFFLHQIYLLAMAGLSPVMLIGSALTERKGGRKAAAARLAEYTEHKARIERDAGEALDAERIIRREQCPDPAAVLAIASGPRRRLWERRRSDPDFLLLRVGTADLPSAVELTDPEQDEHRRTVVWSVQDAPVTIPLPECGVIGVAGPADTARAAGRWAVAQAAILHSPNDLRLFILTDSAGKASWEWVRWLPHCRPAAGRGGGDQISASCAAQVGNDAESVATRIAELLATIAQRQQARGQQAPGQHAQGQFARGEGSEQLRFRTAIMVVLDGSRKLRSLPGVIQLLREGPDVGVYAVCLDTDERLLPAECQAVAVTGPDGLRLQQMMTATISGARPDHVAPSWCARVARAIAPIRDVSDDDEAAGLPEEARLLDVLDLDPPTAPAIAARWRAGGRSTVAMIGESYDGPFGIDIKKDGPHGLVAGTTGSGKSELLQTIVASLAVANRPDEMTFVLIDYKGGSAFADCARLPHTVGMVTDLGPHLVERALISLSAELTRREHLLARVGAKDIEDYKRSDAGSGAIVFRADREPLPRLVIVIDEFASMVRDLPDFVTGLVNIAQRGRSLGIHLILATQRPSGVVSADIRANTNLRIALRVTDAGESSDVIDAPVAANIVKATPGRAYVRLGHASLVPFQAGRVGGPAPIRGETSPGPSTDGVSPRFLRRDPPGGMGGPGGMGAGAPHPGSLPPMLGVFPPGEILIAPVAWAALGRPEPAPAAAGKRGDEEITDLKVLVEQVRIAARELRVPAQPSPWLPPLPDSIQINAIRPTVTPLKGTAAFAANAGGLDGATATFGLEDLPERQLQRAAELSLDSFGHLLAAGAPRSGRSQLLRGIAGALALAHSCADVHVYGLDCGNGALLPLAELPHCGAVVSRNEAERAARLLRRLDAELTRRQEILAAGGFADLTEQRAAGDAGHGDRLPHIFVLLDRWEGFTVTFGEVDGGALTDVITRVLGEGASVGVHLVMTGDRSLLAGRISSLCEEKLVFRLAEREDYALAGLRPRDMPDEIPPGRAFRAGSGVEVQVALLGPDASGPGQGAALRSIAADCALRDGPVAAASRPFRVDAAPTRVTFEQAWALRPTGPGPVAASALWGLVGVGGDSLAPLGPDLSAGVPAFVVAGPGGSGRSTILVSMARSFLAVGTRVVLIAPRPSPLRSLSSDDGVLAAFTEAELDSDSLAAALTSSDGPCVVLIDDAELMRDCDAAGELSRVVAASSSDSRLALVFAGDPEAGLCTGFGGWQVDAKRARRGALTAPISLGEGDLIGARLSRSMVGQPVRPGRCLLNAGDGRLITVTVPLG